MGDVFLAMDCIDHHLFEGVSAQHRKLVEGQLETEHWTLDTYSDWNDYGQCHGMLHLQLCVGL